MRPEPTRVPSGGTEPCHLRLVEAGPEEPGRAGGLPWLAALGAAACGATLWASIGWVTSLEVGYVAWGIGAGVGLAARRSGGRGLALASFAAILSIGAVFAGKLITARITPHSQAFETSGYYTEERYRSAMREAAASAPGSEDPSASIERDPPSFAEWRRLAIERDREALADFPVVEAVIDDLGPVDFAFALLAIATAFGLVARND